MSQAHRTLGEDWRWSIPTVDTAGAAITASGADICIKRVGGSEYTYDETDTEVTPASGAVSVVIPAATTATWAAGTYQIQATIENSSGDIDISTPVTFSAFAKVCA